MSKLLYTRFPKIFIDYLFSLNKSIPCRSDSKLHNLQDDHPITKLLSITNGDYKFGMEVPDAMISDAIKKKARYKYYMAKKVESEKAKIVDKPEEQHVSPIKSGRGKGFMCYGNQVENVPNKLKKDVVPRKTRSLTIAEETVVDMYNEWGQKLKGPAVEDLAVQSLLALRKGSKASRLESLRQKKQPVAGEGSSAAHNKYYSSSNTSSDATLYSLSSDKSEESANEIDDATNLIWTYPMIIHIEMMMMMMQDFIQTLQDKTPVNELTDFMSHPVYTDAHTTLVVHNPEGNPNLTSYISGASEVPLGTHVDDPPNNREGENKKKRRKDVGEPSFRSSRRNKSPVVTVQDDTPAIQPLNKADTLIQKHSNPKWFPKKSGLAKRRTTWFDLFLKSDIDKDENHILEPSTIAIAKKFKELM
ncbi:hypothetical protein Tco_0755156 [Tanacetum coccineum]